MPISRDSGRGRRRRGYRANPNDTPNSACCRASWLRSAIRVIESTDRVIDSMALSFDARSCPKLLRYGSPAVGSPIVLPYARGNNKADNSASSSESMHASVTSYRRPHTERGDHDSTNVNNANIDYTNEENDNVSCLGTQLLYLFQASRSASGDGREGEERKVVGASISRHG